MSPIALHRIRLSQFLAYTVVCALCLLLLVYVAFQARLLLTGPQIRLTVNLPVVQNQQQIQLAGQAENITEIKINGRDIVTDRDGYFSEPIVLQNGYTVVSITAHDRYGRATTLTREFVYTPRSNLETS